MTHREFHLKTRPQGVPTPQNFELVERELPPLKEGEFLVRNVWLSVDPYMRGRMREGASYVPPFELGQPMEGGCVGKIMQSRSSKFQEGEWVLGNQGWREAWISDDQEGGRAEGQGVRKISEGSLDPRHYLSVLGMTGMTAYVGLLKIGNLQENETVFVSAASGAVGSIACQIAKKRNCRVIGSAGSADKIEWLKDKAGVDAAFNYKDTDDVSKTLGEACTGGLDLYFDNVGGDHLAAALDHLNPHGRIVCCGMISGYNDEDPKPGPANLFKIIGKQLRMEGFIVRDHQEAEPEFLEEMSSWVKSGDIAWEETITEGLENAPQAFIDLFQGDKMGKALVKV